MSDSRPLATFGRPSDVTWSYRPGPADPREGAIFEIWISLAGGASGQHAVIARALTRRLAQSSRLRSLAGRYSQNKGAHMSGVSLGRSSESEAWAHIPACTDPADRGQVVDLLRDELVELGARPRTMSLLSWEVAAGDPMVRAVRIFGRTMDIPVEQRIETVLEAVRPHLMDRLGDDHRASAVRYPELVRELHMDLSTMEFLVVRELLESPNRRDQRKPLDELFALHDGVFPYDEQRALTLAEGLAAKGWLEMPLAGQNHVGKPTLFITRGPKARKLTSGDVVPMMIS